MNTLARQKIADALRALECARQNLNAARDIVAGPHPHLAFTLDSEASHVADVSASLQRAAVVLA